MKTKHFFWSALFITIGTLILLNNFSSLNFGWDDLWKFWPIVLILWGVTIIVRNNYFKGLLAAVSGMILAFVLFATFKSGTDIITNNFNWDSKDFNISIDDSNNMQRYNESYDPSIKEAEFKLESGAGAFVINSTSSGLIAAKTSGIGYDFTVNKDSINHKAEVILSMRGHSFGFRRGKFKNKAKIELNANPVWNLNFDIGAASVDFDLRPFKTKNVDIEMGAASLKLKLGNNVNESHVRIKGGASAIEIFVPEDAGCDIVTDISLSSESFNGFNQINSDHYQTENFQNAKNKIYLNIETGVSSVKVIRTNDW